MCFAPAMSHMTWELWERRGTYSRFIHENSYSRNFVCRWCFGEFLRLKEDRRRRRRRDGRWKDQRIKGTAGLDQRSILVNQVHTNQALSSTRLGPLKCPYQPGWDQQSMLINQFYTNKASSSTRFILIKRPRQPGLNQESILSNQVHSYQRSVLIN